MSIQTHIFRRGATYVWRRRIPARIGGGVIQISLRTNEPLIAKRLGLIVSARSCEVFDQMESGRLTRDEARQLLAGIIKRELETISLRRAVAQEDPTPHAWRRAIDDDRAAGRALQILAERGAGAAHVGNDDRDALKAEGFNDLNIRFMLDFIDSMMPIFEQEPGTGLNSTPLRLMRELLGRNSFSQVEMLQGRQLWFQGRGAALRAASEGGTDFDEAADLAAQIKSGEYQEPPIADLIAPEAPPVAVHTSSPEVNDLGPYIEKDDHYDPQMKALIKRLMAQKKKHGVSGQMITQMSRIYDLFIEATGVTDIRNLRQSHVARFVDLLNELPANYRKSAKDRDKALTALIREAPRTAPRLSQTTINRNLDYLGQLLTRAHSEGFANVAMIDLNALRPRKSQRARDERPAFSAADVQAIFRHPVWQGNLQRKKWQEPGPHIDRDGLYWVPLIAALTGARREEIAALKAADIETIDGIAVLQIRANANRGLKTLTSTRAIPLHPQLIELGLIDHAARQLKRGGIDADFFPDLRPRSGAGKFGERIDYRFRLILQRQLTDGVQDKVFHSFRHYVATELGRIDSIREEVRKDILGHAGSSITSERYTETTPLPAMLNAIERLPHLPVKPHA